MNLNLDRKLLEEVSGGLGEPRVIYDREGGSPYLSRWYPLGQRDRDEDENVVSRPPVNLFLHRFHRSDDDGALHSHPWQWGLSLILAGGYLEERRVGDQVIQRRVMPGEFNWIGPDDFHRVDLLEADAWTLFVAGPRKSDPEEWHFWDRERLERVSWKLFIAEKRGLISAAPWRSDSREGTTT